MKLEVGFGGRVLGFEVPEKNLIGILKPNAVPFGILGVDAVSQALAAPIGAPRLREIVSPGEKTVIVTSDITRPCPSHRIIPAVLDELYRGGLAPSDITVVFALGNHRPHTREEMKRLVGESVWDTVDCVDGDPENFVRMGVTKRGTAVDITRVVAEADRRIGIGNIEYHYFAGYSGGAKAIMPGVSARAAIQANHSMMTCAAAAAGVLGGNPVREDIEEAVSYCPLDFIVNVILDEHKEIIHAVCGDSRKAHRAGCSFLDRIYKKELKQKADIVVVSQGGAPKDINLYQTQKALDNAKLAVRDGGIVILVGSCIEGLGESVFEEWMTTAKTPDEMIERIQKDFVLGGHKAAAIAMTLRKARVFLVSEMDADFVRSIFLEPYDNVDGALADAFAEMGEDASVLVMPYGGSTLPAVSGIG